MEKNNKLDYRSEESSSNEEGLNGYHVTQDTLKVNVLQDTITALDVATIAYDVTKKGIEKHGACR